MWKTVKAIFWVSIAWIQAWWAIFRAGPEPTRRTAVLEHLEPAVERALRRVLQSHQARFMAMPDQTHVNITFMDRHERSAHGHLHLPARQRRPGMTFEGRQYVAARPTDDGWIYRQQDS